VPFQAKTPLYNCRFCFNKKLEKPMHLLFLPILADAGMTTASSGAVVIVILSIAAVIRSKMP
jgi:hypothetical protein